MKSKMAAKSHCILFGHKGCGKSYLGSLLANRLQRCFIDTDLLIENSFKDRYGKAKSCRQIAIELGELGFRSLESDAIHNLESHIQAATELVGRQETVIAVGGGTLFFGGNLEILKRLGLLVYLEEQKEVIRQRLFSQGLPSFLDGADPQASFDRMYQERTKRYEAISASGYKICLKEKTVEHILQELTVILQNI